MNILIATVQVPFIRGGAEVLAEGLQSQLRERGHRVDTVALPFKWYPSETLLGCMVTARMQDLQEVNGQKVDLLIGLKFPAFYAPHDRKVIWLVHQHRQAYDLWGTPYGDMHDWPDGPWVQSSLREADTRFLGEARARYTISQNVSDRLTKSTGLDSVPLYHPPAAHEKLACRGWEPYIFYPSRITAMKRQHVLVEAARYLKSDAQIVLAGAGEQADVDALQKAIRSHGVERRVRCEGMISEERKRELYSRCTGVFFGGYDEDYGYITLEAMFSSKPVITLSDAGGALEFVSPGVNGYVENADPRALADRIDALVRDQVLAERLGRNGAATMREKRVDWNHVVDTLLSHAHA
jgi:glycosyltransferase involved in cell wall biosynthesis